MGETATFPLPTSFQILVSMYGYFLPFMLYAAWSTLAFWDIGRRDDLSGGGAIAWILVVLLVPFFGAMAYHIVGGASFSRSLRAAMVGGGLGFYVLVLLAGNMFGGLS